MFFVLLFCCDYLEKGITKDTIFFCRAIQSFNSIIKRLPVSETCFNGQFTYTFNHCGEGVLGKTFDEVWLMPANRHMLGKKMTNVEDRIKMCELATAGDGRIKVSRYEVENDLAGETYHAMTKLMNEDYAKDRYDFSVIIGQDNANSFDKWVNYDLLERLCRFVVVSRIGEEPNDADWYRKPPHIYLKAEDEIPGWSSSMIRGGLLCGNDPSPFVDPAVRDYIKENGLYDRRNDR